MVFDWVVGDEKLKLSLVQPNGAGGSFQVVIDDYYCGQVVRCNGEWLFHLNSKSELSSFEILTLKEALIQDDLFIVAVNKIADP